MIGYDYQIIENLNYVMNSIVLIDLSMVRIITDEENDMVKWLDKFITFLDTKVQEYKSSGAIEEV